MHVGTTLMHWRPHDIIGSCDVIFENESKEGEECESGEGNDDGEKEILMEELVVSHSKKGKPSFVFHNPHQ
jgi:hypothetical protein